MILQDAVYPLYLLLGILLWNFFASSAGSSMKAISGNSNLIKALPLKKDTLILSVLIMALISLLFEFLVFLGFAIYFKVLTVTAFYIFPIMLLFIIFTLGVGLFLSVIYLYIRDVEQVWAFMTRLWWFATPIFYSLNEGGPGEKVSMFNPMYHVIDLSRDVMIYAQKPDLLSFGILAAFAFSSFIIGYVVFRRMSPYLTELV